MKTKKRNFIGIIILILIISISGTSFSFANTISDKKDQLGDVNNQKEGISVDLGALEDDITAQQKKVSELSDSISSKEDEIAKAEIDLAKTEADVKQRKDGLDSRLRVMYKNGSVGFIDVLLGSGSISEFISNVEMIRRIYQNDMDILTTLQDEYDSLKQKKAALKAQREELATQVASANQEESNLEASKQKLSDKLKELEVQSKKLANDIYKLQNPNLIYTGGRLLWPTTSTYITSGFGWRVDPYTHVSGGHDGIDIGVSSGSNVYAAASGKVILSQLYYGYGNAIEIDHGSGLATFYAHNSRLLVKVGDTVKRGQVIAKSGSTGWSTGPHLHFGVQLKGVWVNPLKYLTK